jgi:hypothetical protein
MPAIVAPPKHIPSPLETEIKTLLEAKGYQTINAPNEYNDATAPIEAKEKSAQEIVALIHEQMLQNARAVEQVKAMNVPWFIQFNVDSKSSLVRWSVEVDPPRPDHGDEYLGFVSLSK